MQIRNTLQDSYKQTAVGVQKEITSIMDRKDSCKDELEWEEFREVKAWKCIPQW